MGTRANFVGDRLRDSYWFIPSLMLVAVAFLAWVTTNIDDAYDPEKIRWIGDLIYSGGPDGAREVLSTIASSMITVAGVVFSITIVSLQLASTQFGPRMLANFVRDRGNQVTLGTFLAAFLYSLLVLRTVRTSDPATVPHLSVTFALGLAGAGLAVLIYFIHHIATTIQAPNLIAVIAEELRHGAKHLFPDVEDVQDVSPGPRERQLPADFDQASGNVGALSSGYIEAIDVGEMVKVAKDHDLVVRLDLRPGRFVVAGTPFAKAYPKDRLDDDVADVLARAVVTGARRTPQHDIEFPIRQMVEIAVRALSPAINDPFTASTCVDQIGACLCDLARREFPTPYLVDDEDQLRVVDGDPLTWARLVGASFDQIRQAASFHTAVYVHLLESLTRLAGCVGDAERLDPILTEARLLVEAAERHLETEEDRGVVGERYRVLQSVAAEVAV